MNLRDLDGRGETDLIVGFFDLMAFAKWSEGRAPGELLDLATALFSRTGEAIERGGGTLIKAIGDAGLFAFPAEDPDAALETLIRMKRELDRWLADGGYPGAVAVRVQLGPVAAGRVGAPGAERRDIYGEVVNRAFMMKSRTFAVGETLHGRLGPDLKQQLADAGDGEFVLKATTAVADTDPIAAGLAAVIGGENDGSD